MSPFRNGSILKLSSSISLMVIRTINFPADMHRVFEWLTVPEGDASLIWNQTFGNGIGQTTSGSGGHSQSSYPMPTLTFGTFFKFFLLKKRTTHPLLAFKHMLVQYNWISAARSKSNYFSKWQKPRSLFLLSYIYIIVLRNRHRG